MPVANYNPTGTAVAIQWTGSNLDEIQAALPGWDVFTSTTSSGIAASQHGADSYSIGYHWVDQGSWLVGMTTYGTSPQSPLSAGWTIVDNATFTQQYVAAP